jgi:hypothetical protein
MTYTAPIINTLSKEGVDLTATYTAYDQTAAVSSTNSPDNPGPPFRIGDTCESSNGGEFMFVKASSAISQYDFVGISTNFNAAQLTSTTAAAAPIVAVAQVAIASGAYGWVCLRGGAVSGNVILSTAASVALYPTTVPGYLSATTLVAKVDGVVCTTSRGTTNGSTAVLMSYPTIVI